MPQILTDTEGLQSSLNSVSSNYSWFWCNPLIWCDPFGFCAQIRLGSTEGTLNTLNAVSGVDTNLNDIQGLSNTLENIESN